MSKPITVDIGDICTHCGHETSELNGAYPSGADAILTLGWQTYNVNGLTLNVTVDGLLCPECQDCSGSGAIAVDIPSRPVEQAADFSWDIEDVHERASDDIQLTDDEAREVLRLAKKNHDASIGINWNVIENWIDYVVSERDMWFRKGVHSD